MASAAGAADRLALSERSHAVQGFRAWAMLLIFCFHLHYLLRLQWPNAVSDAIVACNGWGSNLFLCISGFFLHRSLSRRSVSYSDFLRKRLRRLYPVYAFILTLVLAIDIVLQLGRTGLRGELSDLPLLLKNYLLLPVFLREEPILDASWTLAYILGFSLAAPLMAAALRGRAARLRLIAVGVAWVASWGVLPARATLMIAGMFVWELFELRSRWWAMGVITTSGLALGIEVRIALAPALLLIVLAGPEPVRRFLGHPWMQRLGDRSYSFYLAHGLPVLAASHFLFPRVELWQAFALQPVVLCASLLFAECVYQLVEVQFRAPREKRYAARAFSLKYFAAAREPLPSK